MPTSLGSIDHFAVLMLENRSFDHLLGWLRRDDARIACEDGIGPDSREVAYLRFGRWFGV